MNFLAGGLLALWSGGCGDAKPSTAVDAVKAKTETQLGVEAADRTGLWVELMGTPPRELRDLTKPPGPGRRQVLSRTLSDADRETRESRYHKPPQAPDRTTWAEAKPPNILLISMDTTRADHTSTYGYERATTPHLDQLAARGVVFEDAFNNANESIYSHGALLTGRYPSEIARPVYAEFALPDDATLLSEVLKAYDYRTGGFVAGGHMDEAFGHNQGYDHFSSEFGFASFWNTAPRFLEWLGKPAQSQAPWFALVHGYDAHDPFTTASPFNHLFGAERANPEIERILTHPGLVHQIQDGRLYDERGVFTKHPGGHPILSTDTYTHDDKAGGRVLSGSDLQHIADHYDDCVAYQDLQLGLLLAALEDGGWLADTVVIVVADHGEDLAEHGWVNHRTSLTDTVVKVPTVMAGPGIPVGKRVTGMVDSLDVARTIVSIAEATPPAGMRGTDLRLKFDETRSNAEYLFFEGVMDMVAVRCDTHKLVFSGVSLAAPDHAVQLAQADLTGGMFTLTDLQDDPGEHRNLLESSTASSLATAETLRSVLVAWRGDLQVGTHGVPQSAIDPAVAEQMRRHGYWSKK